jgi:hypothetical protein
METAPLLLCTLTPDVLHLVVKRSCDGMHSEDDAAAASAQDTAMALRLTCRTLRATVDGDIKQLTMRATSSEDIKQAAKLFPGVHAAYKTGCLHIDMSCRQQPISRLTPAFITVILQGFRGSICTFQGAPLRSRLCQNRCHA